MYLQVILAIVVSSILATAYVKPQINVYANADKTITEIALIALAAEEHHIKNNIWPDENNNCLDAFTVFTFSPTYLINIDEVNPFYNEYDTSCTDTHFTIEAKSTDIYAGYIQKQIYLPAAIKAPPNTDTVVVTIPKPLSDSLYDKFLALGDTTATATIYQGNNNTIDNIRDITLSDGRAISQAFETKYTIDPTIVTLIPKPICLTGVPDINGSPSALYASNNKGIFGFRIYEDIANSTATDFAIDVAIDTEDGAVPPKNGSAISLTTYCR